MPEFAKAFALTDDPFRLEKSLPGDIEPLLRSMLVTGPLRIAEERRLVDYYCDHVYSQTDPFLAGTPFEIFQSTMVNMSYRNDPQRVDNLNRPAIILIRGHKGTGKTTLAHRMIRWLMDCDSGAYWRDPVFWSGDDENENVSQQMDSLDKNFRTSINKAGNGRFLCLLDDVVKGAEARIFKMFIELQQKRTLFFFLTSSDRDIQAKNYSTGFPPVISYDTKPLTPKGAIEYCKARMKPLRSAPPPAFLSNFPLFPFTEEIIQKCLSPAGGSLWTEPGPVALPQFNVRFSLALRQAIQGLADDFDIAAVPAHQIGDYLIDPSVYGTEQKVA